MSPTCLVTNVPLEVPHDRGLTLVTMNMYLEAPFLAKRRSPLDPESRRTLIALLLATRPMLWLSLGLIAHTGLALADFSSNLVFLDAKSSALSAKWLLLWVALRKLPFVFLKIVITVATAVTLPVFWLSNSFLAFLILSESLGAVSVTLIGQVAVVNKNKSLKGLTILRCLSLPDPVLPYPNSYSLSESLLELYACFLCFIDLADFFWPFWMASSITVI